MSHPALASGIAVLVGSSGLIANLGVVTIVAVLILSLWACFQLYVKVNSINIKLDDIISLIVKKDESK